MGYVAWQPAAARLALPGVGQRRGRGGRPAAAAVFGLAPYHQTITVGANSVLPAVHGQPMTALCAARLSHFGFPGDGVNDERLF